MNWISYQGKLGGHKNIFECLKGNKLTGYPLHTHNKYLKVNMNVPDFLIKSLLNLRVKYFDLQGLSVYSSLKVPTLRDHIKSGGLPYYKVKGKILVKKSEFDQWLEGHRVNKNQNLNNVVDEMLTSLKSH